MLTNSLKTTLMTLRQITEESGVPYSSVRELVLEGHLPRVTLGSSRRFWIRRSDWERYLARSTSLVRGLEAIDDAARPSAPDADAPARVGTHAGVGTKVGTNGKSR